MNDSSNLFSIHSQADAQFADRVLAIYSLVLILIGTPCNLLCCLVYFQKENRSNSIKIIFGYLAILDTIVLYTFNLNYVIREFNLDYQLIYYGKNISQDGSLDLLTSDSIDIVIVKKNLEEYSLSLCRLLSYIAFSILQTSSWILAFGSLNRYLLISKIQYFQFICQRSYTIIICLCITISIFLANIHILWMNGYRSSEGKIICYQNRYFTTYILWYQRIHLCIYSALPSVILFILNSLLMRIVFDSKKRLRSHRSQRSSLSSSPGEARHRQRFSLQSLSIKSLRKVNKTNSRSLNRDSRKLTLSLIFITLSYFVLTFPSTVIFSFFRPYIEPLSLRRTLSLLFTNLSTTTHVIRFFIYYFCSIDFRNNFYNVFSCKKRINFRTSHTK
ncbi:unnamed protein product [Rotaria magnacalcarata]|uniref:G-protein coupled receptors family 1 profile domain-containing protein n=1 Tax=Rotaria magnacalcarata TaxID=392030 RepID=A0A814J451_9BILA|nr:unnamed protein product [Rotaria magnacalcarata]CAF1650037.1 unnamed protein product [Rotaria magnacalcarata]CAF2181326.1 unnamed protein product [Rotaria magnacalcarata]CAF3798850.1 unnamed protein product [Rotaria magnacalcarata]CAF3928651.1 unnamed protein product [Rotaria magnacalcarata]